MEFTKFQRDADYLLKTCFFNICTIRQALLSIAKQGMFPFFTAAVLFCRFTSVYDYDYSVTQRQGLCNVQQNFQLHIKHPAKARKLQIFCNVHVSRNLYYINLNNDTFQTVIKTNCIQIDISP